MVLIQSLDIGKWTDIVLFYLGFILILKLLDYPATPYVYFHFANSLPE